jgi:AraC-type DNA-binding domain-containing proteins
MRPWRALGTVRRYDFESPDYQFVSIPFSGDAPVLEGRLTELQLQPGLWLHCAEVQDLHSMASRVLLEPGLRLVMVLAGELDVSIGGAHLHLRADGASSAVVSMPEPALFERRWRRGKWERKLSLHFTPEWLRNHANLGDADSPAWSGPFGSVLSLPGGGVSVAQWTPSPLAVSLAEQLMLDAAKPVSGLLRLRQAGRALEILYEALSRQDGAIPGLPQPSGMRPREHERMMKVRAFLDDEIQQSQAAILPIDDLGRRFGLSASALQRQFRAAFACSINEYRRSMKLQRARAELEQGGSITEVAERAGYTSPANFATAFRRQFGVCPRDICGRV